MNISPKTNETHSKGLGYMPGQARRMDRYTNVISFILSPLCGRLKPTMKQTMNGTNLKSMNVSHKGLIRYFHKIPRTNKKKRKKNTKTNRITVFKHSIDSGLISPPRGRDAEF